MTCRCKPETPYPDGVPALTCPACGQPTTVIPGLKQVPKGDAFWRLDAWGIPCDRTPAGWHCSRGFRHEGPCAASRTTWGWVLWALTGGQR